MNATAKAPVDNETTSTLSALTLGQTDMLEQAAELREQLRQHSGLDPRTFSLVKIAALVAMDAPPASFLVQVAAALDSGASPHDIMGVLTAVAPQVGIPRVVAAAPEIMIALDLDLPEPADSRDR